MLTRMTRLRQRVPLRYFLGLVLAKEPWFQMHILYGTYIHALHAARTNAKL